MRKVNYEMKDLEKMDNKVFYSQLKKFAVPIALQTFMTAAISAGDSAMLGFVNQDSLAALSAFVWKLPVLVVYFIISMDEVIKLPWVYHHYKRYIWVKDITRDDL